MTEPTTKASLVEARLQAHGEILADKGETLGSWVESRRPATSWPLIADEIQRITGIYVSERSLRLWFPELTKTTPASTNPTAGDDGTVPDGPPADAGPSRPGEQ